MKVTSLAVKAPCHWFDSSLLHKLSHGVTVTHQFLELSFKVRILVGQQKMLFKIIWRRSSDGKSAGLKIKRSDSRNYPLPQHCRIVQLVEHQNLTLGDGGSNPSVASMVFDILLKKISQTWVVYICKMRSTPPSGFEDYGTNLKVGSISQESGESDIKIYSCLWSLSSVGRALD